MGYGMPEDSDSILQSNYIESITVIAGMFFAAALFLTTIALIGIVTLFVFQNTLP